MIATPLGERLFYPHPALPGILKCAKCDELFISASHIQSLRKELRAEGTPTNWLPTPNAESARRRTHAQNHLKRCEATYADDGYFRLPPVAPAPTTARDFGFTR
jgi:hypothetical protein